MDKETLEGLQQLTNLVLKNTLAIIETEKEIKNIYNKLNNLIDIIPDKENKGE